MTDEQKAKIVEYLLEASDKTIKAENVTPEMQLRDDLDLDSMQAVTMVMDLEDEFGVSVTDEEVAKFKTVGDIIKIIDEKMGDSQ